LEEFVLYDLNYNKRKKENKTIASVSRSSKVAYQIPCLQENEECEKLALD
jgi:hypothetical protein